MCNLSNDECKELMGLLKSYQEFIIKKELDNKVNDWLSRFSPYAKKAEEYETSGSSGDEYDPQF